MVCLAAMLNGVEVAIREKGKDRIAVLTEERELFFMDRPERKVAPPPVREPWTAERCREAGADARTSEATPVVRQPLTEEMCRVTSAQTSEFPPAAVGTGPPRATPPVKRRPGRPPKRPVAV